MALYQHLAVSIDFSNKNPKYDSENQKILLSYARVGSSARPVASQIWPDWISGLAGYLARSPARYMAGFWLDIKRDLPPESN